MSDGNGRLVSIKPRYIFGIFVLITLFILWFFDVFSSANKQKDPVQGPIQMTVQDFSWREEGGVIYFSVTSEGASARNLTKRLEESGSPVRYDTDKVTAVAGFKPTKGVTTEIAVLKGSLFNKHEMTKNIRAEAGKRQLGKPDLETAHLILQKLTPEVMKSMGLRGMVVMHSPFSLGDYHPRAAKKGRDWTDTVLLAASFHKRWWFSSETFSYDVTDGWPDAEWFNDLGFAFVVSQVAAPPSWREENGVISFSVTSDGTTGEEWIKRLESKGFRMTTYAKDVLRSKDFKPTKGVTTEVSVLKGTLFRDRDRTTKKIHVEAKRRKLSKPNAEVACLIREFLTDEEIEAMGLSYIVAMHEPINDRNDDPDLLAAIRDYEGRWFGAIDASDGTWPRDDGFAFAK